MVSGVHVNIPQEAYRGHSTFCTVGNKRQHVGQMYATAYFEVLRCRKRAGKKERAATTCVDANPTAMSSETQHNLLILRTLHKHRQHGNVYRSLMELYFPLQSNTDRLTLPQLINGCPGGLGAHVQ